MNRSGMLISGSAVWRIAVVALLAVGLSACGARKRSVEEGGVLFAANCAICHGADARGGGGAGVRGLSRTPSDLTILSAQNGSEFPTAEVLWVLSEYQDGLRHGQIMRGFDDLSSEKRKRIKDENGRSRAPAPQVALVRYLESIQRPSLQGR